MDFSLGTGSRKAAGPPFRAAGQRVYGIATRPFRSKCVRRG
jgi:hypothetical protein